MTTPTDDLDIDPRLDAHLRRTLQAVAGTVDPGEITVRPLRPRRRYVLAAAAVVLAVGGVVLQPFGSKYDPGWTAAAMELAESAPRLLITADGWTIETAGEVSTDEGQVTFTGQGRELEMNWGTNGTTFDYDVRLFELEESVTRLPDVTIGDRTFAVFDYFNGQYAALWQEDGYGIEVRGGTFPTVDEFLAVVGTVEQVDTNTWLEAMPPVVVLADARAAAVDEMLADMPLPEGFEPARFDKIAGAVTSRYELGAHVSGRVACAWVNQWIDATKAGDAEASQQAVAALGTSREWDILLEMEPEGFWSHEVWAAADDIATGGVDELGHDIREWGVHGIGCGRD